MYITIGVHRNEECLSNFHTIFVIKFPPLILFFFVLFNKNAFVINKYFIITFTIHWLLKLNLNYKVIHHWFL